MKIKTVPLCEVKAGPDDGLAEGEFLVYPSTFTREPDAYGDVVAKGAFVETIEKWLKSGDTLPGLYGHRMDDPDYFVAGASDMGEDDHGWWVRGFFDMESPKGPQVYRLVKGRRLRQLSFAYDVREEALVDLDDGRKANELRKLDVHEFSFVPIGANQDTSVVAIKGLADVVAADLKAGRVLSSQNETALRDSLEDLKTVRDIDAKAQRADEHAQLLKQLGELSADEDDTPIENAPDAKTLGEHLVKSGMFDRLKAAKSNGGRWSVTAPEFKAPLEVGDLGQTQYGRTVPVPLRRVTVPQLLAQGTMGGTSLTYFQQGEVTGDFTAVAEGGEKPELTFDGDPVTETLSKVAGWTSLTDEANEDIPAFVSVVENQLLARHAIAEEASVLNGSGTGANMTGLLNRSGVLTESAAAVADNMDAIFRGMTKVQQATFLGPDAIVINPTDYQALRLSKDGNDQYYAGGPFSGAYGNGGIVEQPGIWGLRTVVTQAIPAGTVLVGAFQPGGQLFRKGGVRVESTNTDQDDFIFNRMKIRAESRLLLAVYYPSAFCKVTLSSGE